MDTHSHRAGSGGDTLIRFCASLLNVCHCWRRYSAVRKYLIIALVGLICLLFTIRESHSSHDKRPEVWTRNSVYTPDQEVNESVSPTRCNVVYITLKSKRHKPAILRGTVRPKLRRKKVLGTAEKEQDSRIDAHHSKEQLPFGDLEYSSIRIYSERAPPWFSDDDITAMRFLAESKITEIAEVSLRGISALTVFKSETNGANGCQNCSGVIKRPLDMSEVFAFHLDRILGLNRTLPVVTRRFLSVADGQPCPVVLWDPTLSRVADKLSENLNWGLYQASLRHKCWHRGVTPKPEWRCTSIQHHEWSKLVLFDFLMQIYERLDKNCCGFKPRPEDTCVVLGHHDHCQDKSIIELTNILHRRDDPRNLIFFNNKGYFDRDEGNLDFVLLEGIKEVPEVSVSVLRSQRLREKLLQSLFLDQLYWDSQGGRQGIEKLIDVIERRAKVLLTYINAHGIKVVPMDS
ncbi:hypothetical protein DNTS_021884 [Danionella cerebrum]|uniref:Golgi associated kinase 1B n=1 Tax=Danionella cerebrum TaxID=2873325 RepID=A0A553R5E9_9TELE|nr:hypothetical protein DNTS_021884 [Danionella translucida]